MNLVTLAAEESLVRPVPLTDKKSLPFLFSFEGMWPVSLGPTFVHRFMDGQGEAEERSNH